MPGLVGFSKEHGVLSQDDLLRARDQIKHESWYKDDDVFEDERVLATRTHLDVVGEKTSPHSAENIVCWVEGEVYNLQELNARFPDFAGSFPGLLVASHARGVLSQFLSQVNGYFVAVLYDRTKGTIALISDRYGLKPLYYWNEAGRFAWASEIKAFLALPSFSPVIRQDAFDCFMGLRHMIGDVTWFEHVDMIPAATVLTYNLTGGRVEKERYWSWSAVKPMNIGFDDAVAELGRRLVTAVESRVGENEKIVVGLSGGLDSRLLLAASGKDTIAGCWTLGKPGSPDVEIARRASGIAGCRHWFFELNANNWLEGRSDAVWTSDGMRSFVHIHEAGMYRQLKEIADINLNGFLGDVVAGGGWFIRANQPISEETAHAKYGGHHVLDPIEDGFFDIHHEDPYLINNRGRRATNMGSITGAVATEQRLPFMDNNLIELLYGLPDEYRANSRLYNAALLSLYPRYFEKLPWQKTGLPINKTPGALQTVLGKARKGLLKLGIAEDRSQFADYKNWIRGPEASVFFRNLLAPSDALYRQYTGEDFNECYLEPHLAGRADYREEIGRAASAEIWLRRVFKQLPLE
jgi:asparagine synthetase B (glutamine-hydrolysing)